MSDSNSSGNRSQLLAKRIRSRKAVSHEYRDPACRVLSFTGENPANMIAGIWPDSSAFLEQVLHSELQLPVVDFGRRNLTERCGSKR